MRILEKHQGCVDEIGCMGPMNSYYTLFGSEVSALGGHLIISFFICAFVYYLLIYHLKKTYLSRLPKQLVFIMFFIDSLIIFLLLTYLFPVKRIY